MPWVGSVMDQRLAFVGWVESGLSISEACRRYGISRPTGYKWLSRYQADGIAGLADRSRRPYRSPDQTDTVIEARVVAVREQFPTWGGRKIRAFLLRQGHQRVPAASTITRILTRHGLIEPSPPRSRSWQQFQAAAPNELWQIDFKGHFPLSTGQRCHPLGMLDDHSRYNLCLAACPNQRTTTVQTHLTEAFSTYGLPRLILSDNGPPWGTSNPQFRWTPLKVWLADRGIRVIHSRPRHPQTLGKEERFPLPLTQDLLPPLPAWPTLTHAQTAFDNYRIIYNQHRPHQSLNDDPPADRYLLSPRPLPTHIPPPTYPPDWTVRIVDKAAHISINGTTHKIGKPFIGRTVALQPQTNIVHYRDIPIKPVNHVPERA